MTARTARVRAFYFDKANEQPYNIAVILLPDINPEIV